MIYVFGLAILGFSLASLASLYRYRRRNPLFLFITFNLYFSIGTLTHLDMGQDSDIAHATALLVASISISIYSFLMFDRKKFSFEEYEYSIRARSLPTRRDLTIYVVLFLTALAVSFFYFQVLVGYNLISLALSPSANLDFTTLRLQSYAGAEYKGAGIVNQFKNTLLPAMYIAVILSLYYTKKKIYAVLFGIAFFIPVLWCLLGTGQRTFLMLSAMALFIYFWNSDRKIGVFSASAVAVMVGGLFSFMSVVLGRSESLSISDSVSQMIYRAWGANQLGTTVGFRYVYQQEIQYGAEWARVLWGFIPGMGGSTLSNEVFAVVYGGMRGTIPVSLWTSLYHNFGMWLIPPIAWILLRLVDRSHSWLNTGDRSIGNDIIYAFLCVYVMVLPISNPFQIINNGLIGIILFYVVGYFSHSFGRAARTPQRYVGRRYRD